jgi:hypothetical protein
VVDVLRDLEADLVAANVDALPDELVPEADVVSLADLAAEHGVSVTAVEDKSFPEHDLVGRTLVRPSVLDAAADRVETGMSLSDVESVLDEYALDDASAVLSRFGYRVEWEGLGGGTIQKK